MRNKGWKGQWEHDCEGFSIEGQTEDLSLRLGLASAVGFGAFTQSFYPSSQRCSSPGPCQMPHLGSRAKPCCLLCLVLDSLR